MLRSWRCQSSWQSNFLWDSEILVWPNSWDPGILRSWDPWCVRTPGSSISSGDRGALIWVRNHQKEPDPLIMWGSCVCAPAVPRHSQFCLHRCCVPLTSDPKILGVLGHLWGGESSGDCGTACRGWAQGGPVLALNGRQNFLFSKDCLSILPTHWNLADWIICDRCFSENY